MLRLRTLVALSAVAVVTACAVPGGPGGHAGHASGVGASAPMAVMQDRMKGMREMRDKMMNAKTPEERQALMADHMKAMHAGMQMMKGMEGKPAAAGAGDPKTAPADMTGHHQMMEGRMDMMQTMMEMMMQRMPASPR